MKRIAVLGATSAIAQGCLREWAGRGAAFRLVGRDADRLARVAADLRARGDSVRVEFACHDLSTVDAVAAAVDWVFAGGPVDVLLVAVGAMPPQAEAEADPRVAHELLELNGTMNLLAAHLATRRLLTQGGGSLAVIGSVAGDRGRQSNYLYGAAKSMLATGVAGIQHSVSLAGSPVRVTLVKPGPTATPMTDHLAGGPVKLAKVERVASDIVAAIDAGRPVVYTPRKWRVVMAVVRVLPRRVFERTRL